MKRLTPIKMAPALIGLSTLLLASSCGHCAPTPKAPTEDDCRAIPEYADLVPVFRWRSSAEHFWTTDVRGESASRLGYVSEGPVFYVSEVQSARFSVPIQRLRTAAGHIYTIDRAVYQRLLANGASEEGILGYIAPVPIGSCGIPLHEWSRPSDELRFLTTNMAEQAAIEAQGFSHHTVAGNVASFGPRSGASPYRVGIYYFGMFSRDAIDDALSIQQPDGSWKLAWPLTNVDFFGPPPTDPWWMGIRNFHEHDCTPANPTTAPPELAQYCSLDWSYLKPALGWYDLRDKRIVEAHIRQASQYGISFFTFYWFWDKYRSNEVLHSALDNFVAARNSNEMSFSLAICEHGGHLVIPDAEQARMAAKLIVSKYVSRPNFLRTRAGSPILSLCDTSGISSEALSTFLETLRIETHALPGGHWPVLLAFNPEIEALVEGGACLTHSPGAETYHASAVRAADWLIRRKQGKPLMPCFFQMWDDRPRMGMKTTNFSYYTDFTADYFAEGLNNVKTWMDSKDDELSHVLTLYAWNEWHEGGRIEPNVRDQTLYLRIISDAFQLPIGTHPCRTTGLCLEP